MLECTFSVRYKNAVMFFFSSRRRHTRYWRDWSSDVCSSDLKAGGVQIFIGHESGYQILDDCSVVTAPYAAGDSVVGVVGVIGPTRMAYERVIPIVKMTAKLLGAALNSRR